MVVIHRGRMDPARELAQLRRRMDRFWDEGFVRPWERRWSGCDCLPVDVYSTAESYVVRTNVPGVKAEDVNVTIEGDTLTIKATFPEPVSDVEYAVQERESGEYARTLSFSVPIQPEAAEAVFENGVLTLTIPKAEEVKPKTIKIKTG